ncbi:DEAD/DEAH box helicase [endosymbiont of Riftia pachyptila]|nr:DEAD/DEAH box helicase [endosymbiont of Riftia pachyptila]
MSTDSPIPFDSLGLSEPIMQALADVGYESPSPIQQASIPPLLEGKDLLGQAQTGTGKTAAFALPLLSRIDLSRKTPQFLVLAPTRELAIQVAEAMQSYARHIKGFHVLPIYGGQPYDHQLRQLRRGVQVVVGTPGRVMDHIRRGTLKLDNLDALVLDEADEMLRMGFIDDVEWILEQTPQTRQIALFSATMPSIIRKVAQRHLNDPTEIKIAAKTSTATTIRQRYWQVSGLHKLDALTRILECESFDAMLVFVRTKIATVELAEKLEARGYASEALNGDIPQKQRERTVERFKAGRLDILVATDVAARGLDVERISHVINYDIPYDTESYVHRIGRTGRAGRTGDAILFVSPKERRLLRTIERATRQPIERMQMPSAGDINEKRMQRFKDRISDALAGDDLDLYYQIVSAVQQESDADPLDVAAAVARLLQGDEPLLLVDKPHKRERPERSERQRDTRERDFDKPRQREPRFEKPISAEPKPLKEFPEIEMVRYRIEVGYQHEVKPGNIVGAIANEADIESSYIGHIEIHDDFSTIDLPEGMPKEILQLLRKVRVCGRSWRLRHSESAAVLKNRHASPSRTSSVAVKSGRIRGATATKNLVSQRSHDLERWMGQGAGPSRRDGK